MSDLRFDGRVAVITGGGRGLGREYALLLAAQGCKIVVNDNGSAIIGEGSDAGPAEEVVAEIKAAGGEAIAVTDSVATEAGGNAIIQKAIDTWGRIDILIHNAGNVRYGSLKEISHEDFHAVVDVHLIGGFNVVRAAFPHMAKAKYGRIVLTSSIGGVYGNATCVNYAVSKMGLIGLNNVTALEGVDEGIQCNAILPGAVTRMADGLDISQYPPMGPELVAPVVAWMCHETCNINGEMISAMAGRISQMYVGETDGIYRPKWSIKDVGEVIDKVHDRQGAHAFGLNGYLQHLGYSFEVASKGVAG